MFTRKIIRIDEEKCDGCGECVPACHEGAIKIVNGKAKLVNERYCDGLGACLGECPQGAITIEEREAAAFDEKAVAHHLEPLNSPQVTNKPMAFPSFNPPPACPGGTLSPSFFKRNSPAEMNSDTRHNSVSGLRNWPIQLMLAPTEAPYFDNAELVIAADCVGFAFASFDKDILSGKCLLIACPKLDKVDYYRAKLTEIFQRNTITKVTIAFMEVPCCFGLVHLVSEALARSGKEIPVGKIKLGIQGDILENSVLPLTSRGIR